MKEVGSQVLSLRLDYIRPFLAMTSLTVLSTLALLIWLHEKADLTLCLHTYACKDTPTLVKSKIIVGQIAAWGVGGRRYRSTAGG